MKILICGLPGTGKTTLAKALAPLIGATVFDGDEVRAHYNLTGFSENARLVQAKRMRWLCEQVTASGNPAIASFICPTMETRNAFDATFTIWIDRNGNGKYPDTQAVWEDPRPYHLRVTNENSPVYWADKAAQMIRPSFHSLGRTALFVGRWQPFHEGHAALIEEGIKRYGQVCIGVRHSAVEWPYERVRQRIEARLRKHAGKFIIIPLPNITHVCHGRQVGWDVVEIPLSPEVEAISGTKLRAEM